ncbi:MAG: hypothetical protein NC918_04795 [Candidatus Omnitrophica bacterium]|nr:hypothetical protein [Candidatus Omnitrophota bacterium]
MSYQIDERIEKTILKYQKKIYSLILYLVGGDKNKAYDICVDTFVDVFNLYPLADERVFFVKLVKTAIQKSNNIKAVPSKEILNLIADVKEQEKIVLSTIFEALLKLDFENRALLLLRYQLNLTIEEISKIFSLSASQILCNLITACEKLNKTIKQIVSSSY